jgi:hypothetical protein
MCHRMLLGGQLSMNRDDRTVTFPASQGLCAILRIISSTSSYPWSSVVLSDLIMTRTGPQRHNLFWIMDESWEKI